MSSLPTIVLVHGAWHTPANYSTYVNALQKQGFQVHCPRLPTSSNARPPTAFLPEDVACVKELVNTLIDDGQRVLMIMHSYGGAVGSSAVEGLSLSERKASGKPGGVIHLLYLCAYILPTGYSMWNIVREAKFEKVLDEYMTTTTDGLTMPKEPALSFFSGKADQATVDKALETLVWFPSRVLKDPTTGCAWKTIPTTYIRTLQDFGVPAVYQDIMLAKVQEEGVVVKTEVYDADHSIFITMEREMVQAAINAAADERNTM
ncbi:hypothetical protein N7494_008835 [Penicillium frequentans]|uniref:AB hydrolase-1 domain-containing protein n=1 Tax=Penicillium frequentans TaxID=3151616 RepID=A0AAD6CNR3_9EURO|nr:hypothetical protein N7494_008835 [Penicillium glabrum]